MITEPQYKAELWIHSIITRTNLQSNTIFTFLQNSAVGSENTGTTSLTE